MCYEAFVDGTATDRSFRALRRDERRDALVNGLEAGVLVAVVLLWHGVAPVPTGGSAVLAVVGGFVLHQAVFVTGVGLIRIRSSLRPKGGRHVS